MGRHPRAPGKPTALPTEAADEEEAIAGTAASPEAEPSYRFYSSVLRARRNELGLTQVQLAVKADLSLGTVALIERSQQNPTLKSLVTLAEAVGLKIGDLLPRSISAEEDKFRSGIAALVDQELKAAEAQLIATQGQVDRTQEQINRLMAISRTLREGHNS